MNKEKLNELLDSVYELEGLIHLALNRDDNPDHLALLISRKGEIVGKVAASLNVADSAKGDDEEVEVVEKGEIIHPEYNENKETRNNSYDPEPIILAPLGAPEDISELAEEESAPEEEAAVMAAVSVPIENIESEKEMEKVVEDLAGVEEQAMEEIVEDIAKVSLEKAPAPVVEETVARTPNPETRGRLVFTLNDKFRFKRELFGNSDADFNNTLSYVASLDNYLEAEDYFLTELQWNPDREEVKEFLEILKKYFK
ncbi:MAG: hypothetical protein HDS10_07595 [Bacteroides sp.]|nr:hypothetical protein [Bacteroides sp.]